MRKVGLYILVTFALSWGLFGLFILLGGRYGPPWSAVVSLVYMFTPAAAVLIVQKLVYREGVIRELGVFSAPNWWYLAAWLAPLTLSLGALGVGLLLPGVDLDPSMEGFVRQQGERLSAEEMAEARRQTEMLPIHPFWVILVGGMGAGLSINAVAGFGEELGWRGLMRKELMHLGFWRMSALVGVVWGFWHAPLILQGHNYPQHPRIGVLMMVVFGVLISPLFSYVRARSRSVVAPAVLHGTLNGVAGLAVIVLAGGNDLSIGVSGLSGFAVLLLVNLSIYLHQRATDWQDF